MAYVCRLEQPGQFCSQAEDEGLMASSQTGS